MKLNYYTLLLTLLVGVLLWPATAQAQDFTECPNDQVECVVDWAADDGVTPVVNALRQTIANDTLDSGEHVQDRIYVLKRGGFYWITDPIQNEGFHLRLEGQTLENADPSGLVCGESGEEDCGPAIIQRVAREDGSAPAGTMFESNADLTVRNIWIMGQDDQGTLSSYEPIKLLADGGRYTFDNVIFDRNDWHHLGPDAPNVDFFVTNSVFRNIFGPTQRWEGLGVRFEAGADTVVFENNTFFNIGFTPFQSEAAPMNYFRSNHNTFVNVGRSFQAGALWKEAYVANNIFVNPFWHGEDESQYGDPDREDPYTGFFGIGALPARFGTNFDREILLANNSYWRDDAFNEYYDEFEVRAQPLVNDTTTGYFAQFDGMVMQNNLDGVRPDFANAPLGEAQVDSMIQMIMDIRAEDTPAQRYFWDPGRDEGCFVCINWPLPEDFSYTDPDLLVAGTDDLPLGDLNWFPEQKEDFLENQAQYVTALEELAAGLELEPIALEEAESGTLEGDASIEVPEGEKYFYMEGGGNIQWTFEAPEDGVYSLVLYTRSQDVQRGQHVRIDGTAMRNDENYGEFYFDSLPPEEWQAVEITQDILIEGQEALDLTAGEHTIEIAPSWGYQAFLGVDVLDAGGNAVAELGATDAVSEGVREECTDADYCPQGFSAVALGAGGSVSFDVTAPAEGNYMVRVFYAASAPASADVMVNGEVASSLSFDADTSDVFTDQFVMGEGANTVTLMSASGGITIDYVQLILVGGSVATEPNELPEGYALHQNYPNPFNPATTIQYELGTTADVTLTVYDVLGREVMTLVDGRQVAGQHRVTFDGATLASGVYFYRLETPVGRQVRKMILVK